MRLPRSPSSEILRSTWPARTDGEVLRSWVGSVRRTREGRPCVGDEAIQQATKALGCTVDIDAELVHDGGLRLVDGQLSILVGGRYSQPRRRFTIAHELGHAALYRLNESADQSDHGTERLCDMFAAELLVPQAVVRELGRVGPYPWVLISLLERTGTSAHVVGIAMWTYLRAAVGFATSTGEILSDHIRACLPPLPVEAELRRLASDQSLGFATCRLSRVWQLEMLRRGDRLAFAVRPVATAPQPERAPMRTRSDENMSVAPSQTGLDPTCP